ncbi:hypothetical protein J4Q44_G00173770 [Coregonus suidteri]|uniref:Ig-like domain-containing protein n=1 Tax=Coregonus suidteri TaxID=861788 RepID=A0AAN8LFH6_9TELE
MCEIIFSRIFLGFPVLLLWMAGRPTHAACPFELNPPRLVVRYGDSVSVNCSTSSTDHEGMGWEATYGGTGLEEANFVIWTVENLTDWTIQPKCYIAPKDGIQCLENFPVILYKIPDSVSISLLSHSGPMVEGTEYQLQCDIQNVAPLQNLVVRWYKGNETVNTLTFNNSRRKPEDVSSTLNITPRRFEDEVEYRCEAELVLGPEGPQPSVMSSQHLHFAVYFPPQDILELKDTEVDVGSRTGLKCSSNGNPRPEYSWTYHRAPNVKLKNDGVSLLTIEQATGENIGYYTCYASNTLGNVSKRARVSVRGAEPVCPMKLSTESVVVEYGSPVSVSCSNTTSVEEIYWTTGPQVVNDTTWSVVELLDWDIRPDCKATFQGIGRCSKPLHITVYKTPDSVSISVLSHSGPMVEGTEYQLQCDIQNIAPQQNLVVKWYKGNEPVDNVTYSNISKTPVDVSAPLMISPSRDDDGAQYRCRAELDLGPEGPQPHPTVTSEPLNITVHYAPKFLPGNDTVVVSAGSDVSLDCSAEGNPPPELKWTNNTAEGNDNETIVGRLRTLSISRVTANATYNCTVTNRLGSITKQMHVLVEVPPQRHLTMFPTVPTTPGATTTLPAAAKPKVVTSPLELNPPRVVVRYGDSVSVNCSTSSTDHEGMGWEATYGGTGLEQDVNIVTWTVDNLTDWTIEPKCYITLNDSNQPIEVLPVILYKTPDSVSISVLSHSGPMVEGTEYQLQCDIQNIAPQQNLVVKWYKGNEPVDNVTYSNIIMTPVDVSAPLMISPSRDDDGAQYRCRAELDLGPEGPQPHPSVTSEPLSITVHYKPRINASRLPLRIPVFRGYPEELVCEAEGYPQPRIQWLYDPAKHVSEAGGNLTVSEAGLYNCTATNDVETSFIVVEVVLKEDYLPLIAGFVAFMVVVISVIFVFIYSIYYKNTKMGRYSLKNAKLSSTPNGNVAQDGGQDIPLPMTKLSQPNIYF